MTTVTERFSLEVPAMYADHHVTEVRRILLEIPGVSDVYASSSFSVVEGTFDSSKTNLDDISAKLTEAGYLGDFQGPIEASEAASANGNGNRSYSRHTAFYEQLRTQVSFGQDVSYLGRPLWPCPGMGVIRAMEE